MEGLTYDTVLAFCQSWSVVYFSLMFAVAFAYAFWPSNKKRFSEAAYMPLRDSDGDE
ncbi:MAG: cbb3-type cytochrome c oxidase subunit 3 [Alphaproteobacteria bacterium]|nr:cbb3-type cytochrome c oxidase subunit 3 [Alphaproteobacteria bacterium]MBL6937734.1 cbb3-type cytochrome c oxidase subunit 3 [Alphaproteobacteria bacterium]MBL7099072.1 cbb3-type cytochrome c oxidase subunit 3 [Alphaproteobacteria bacterium]